jgi:hypothetical protein
MYEGGQVYLQLQVNFAVSALNTIVKDPACINEHMNFISHLVRVCPLG